VAIGDWDLRSKGRGCRPPRSSRFAMTKDFKEFKDFEDGVPKQVRHDGEMEINYK